MSGKDKYSSLPQDGNPVQFNACSDDPVLPDDVDREQASRSSLENCDVPSENSYLPDSGPASLVAPENPYYEKLIGIDAEPAAYPEDLIMIGSSVDVHDDSKPSLLLSEEPTISETCNDVSADLNSKGSSSQPEKTIMVMPEDIEAAGLSMQNLNDLTEAQFNTLVEIAERRERNAGPTLAAHNQYGDQMPNNSASTDSLTIIIADDGSLKVTDACGQMLVFQNLGNNSEVAAFKSSDTVPRVLDEQMEGRVSDQAAPRNASIRYVKNGRWKVQYEDGRFEWVGEGNSNVCEVKPVQHSDHSGYHVGNTSCQTDSSVLMSSPRLKRTCSTDSPFDGGPAPLKRRGIAQAPNFCCPVCDRKVYQKEPSYIVIRLPACDDCTKGKMIVLDERTKRLSLPTVQK
ncbi:hypothetical protein NECAME_14232 [Necator americanus]|uniref:Uncharacterized protein n=1 Tax=Necator americanus TaxID=51031 RepID=W2SP50_NECAM|nr:hypothetical protein NECAME_14232 [Necator americanus]ETN71420.1 hypothetical protein NECAME_14232 [Necator americanus]